MRARVLLVSVILGLLMFGGAGGARAAIDCSSFANQRDAQAHLRQNIDDPDGLDGPIGRGTSGMPGVACESLPDPHDYSNVYTEAAATTTTVAVTTTTAVITVTPAPATTIVSTVAAANLAGTGLPPYATAFAIIGVGALLCGVSMRGRRAAGQHWS